MRVSMGVIGSVYMLNGNVYRVCTGSVTAVKAAAVKALNRMRIKVASIGKMANQDVIVAMSGERNVEVWVKALSEKTVRLGISAKQSGEEDIRTAAEIIAQTERVLAGSAGTP